MRLPLQYNYAAVFARVNAIRAPGRELIDRLPVWYKRRTGFGSRVFPAIARPRRTSIEAAAAPSA